MEIFLGARMRCLIVGKGDGRGLSTENFVCSKSSRASRSPGSGCGSIGNLLWIGDVRSRRRGSGFWNRHCRRCLRRWHQGKIHFILSGSRLKVLLHMHLIQLCCIRIPLSCISPGRKAVTGRGHGIQRSWRILPHGCVSSNISRGHGAICKITTRINPRWGI